MCSMGKSGISLRRFSTQCPNVLAQSPRGLVPAMHNNRAPRSDAIRPEASQLYFVDQLQQHAGRIRGLVVWPCCVPKVQQHTWLPFTLQHTRRFHYGWDRAKVWILKGKKLHSKCILTPSQSLNLGAAGKVPPMFHSQRIPSPPLAL